MADAPIVIVPERNSGDWLDDMRWHRRMFAQSKVRWAPEDARDIALRWVHGRCSFETPGHLRRLEAQHLHLLEHTAQIQDAMAPDLKAVRNTLHRSSWAEAFDLLGMTERESSVITIMSRPLDPKRPNPDVRRALRGIPLANPLSRVWELRQMHTLYDAAANLLEDELCDLATELAPAHGWDNLAALTTDHVGWQLSARVEEQRRARGGPEDSRRHPQHRY